MKEKSTRPLSQQRKPGNSDLTRLRKMKDTEIDYSDIPELDEDFWARAELYTRPKESISVRIDADVMKWLRSKGKGYQTRLNAILRAVMDQEGKKR